jgi:hypothetical protein
VVGASQPAGGPASSRSRTLARVPRDSDAETIAGGGRPQQCFVVMAPGEQGGATIDFDAVFDDLLVPAIHAAGLEPLRADPPTIGGPPLLDRLVIAHYAIFDLTTADANVVYELGVRHAARPYSTVLVGAEIAYTPFHLAPDRVWLYKLDAEGRPADPEGDRAAIVKALRAAVDHDAGSPAFALIDDLPTPDIDRLKTDVFREQARYSSELKQRLEAAREEGIDALNEVERDLGALDHVEAGVIVDLLLSYRAAGDWADMIRLVEALPDQLRRTTLVREQYGLALNRAGRGEDAEAVLIGVLQEHGPSSETLALLGRVYKDRWQAELDSGSDVSAARHLDAAIDAYRRGFEADWRDAYPGINAVTLMELRDPGGSPQQELLPVVRYANRRRIEAGAADYWDHATRLELAVLAHDRADALEGMEAALDAVREGWEPASTANNLSLIRGARARCGENVDWAEEIEDGLKQAAAARG